MKRIAPIVPITLLVTLPGCVDYSTECDNLTMTLEAGRTNSVNLSCKFLQPGGQPNGQTNPFSDVHNAEIIIHNQPALLAAGLQVEPSTEAFPVADGMGGMIDARDIKILAAGSATIGKVDLVYSLRIQNAESEPATVTIDVVPPTGDTVNIVLEGVSNRIRISLDGTSYTSCTTATCDFTVDRGTMVEVTESASARTCTWTCNSAVSQGCAHSFVATADTMCRLNTTLDPDHKQLQVQPSGIGEVEVLYTDRTRICRSPSTCSYVVPNDTAVKLTPNPGPRHSFKEWAGDCAGMASAADVTVTDNMTCEAVFQFMPELTVAITADSDAGYVIRSSTHPVNCGTRCTLAVPQDDDVALYVDSDGDGNSAFTVEWGGDCSGNVPGVTVPMDRDKECIVKVTEVDCSVPGQPTVDVAVIANRGGVDTPLTVDTSNPDLYVVQVNTGDVLTLDARQSTADQGRQVATASWQLDDTQLNGLETSFTVVKRTGDAVRGSLTVTDSCNHAASQNFRFDVVF